MGVEEDDYSERGLVLSDLSHSSPILVRQCVMAVSMCRSAKPRGKDAQLRELLNSNEQPRVGDLMKAWAGFNHRKARKGKARPSFDWDAWLGKP